ncbi:MAG: hypothetical protein HY319_08095 [Armatimonadetes bacterium]|nr:hypothetical protein [Armatimonadota bacterium]
MTVFVAFFVLAGPGLLLFNVLVAAFVGWKIRGGGRHRLRRVTDGPHPFLRMLEHLLSGRSQALIDLMLLLALTMAALAATVAELLLVLVLCSAL